MPSDSVILVPHDPRWATQFTNEAALLRGLMHGNVIDIHHIGSTAIEGIVAKPIIDILIVVESIDAVDTDTQRLVEIGYEAMGEFGIPGRRFFRKHDADRVRTHHLHAFRSGSPEIMRHVAFRDHLRTHRDDALAYETLKLDLARRFPHDRERYTDGKSDFIRRIDALARQRRA